MAHETRDGGLFRATGTVGETATCAGRWKRSGEDQDGEEEDGEQRGGGVERDGR
jgi:hypothetical protein